LSVDANTLDALLAGRRRRQLAALVRRKGGRATVRQLMRWNCSRYATADAARQALDDLVRAGLGIWALANVRGKLVHTFVLDVAG
jgi:hypothetical protein